MNNKRESGSSVLLALLVIIVVALTGFTGWYVWHSGQVADNTYSQVAQDDQGASSTLPAAPISYLKIPELGIKIPLNAELAGAKYKMVCNNQGQTPCAWLTIPAIDKYPGCSLEKNGAGVATVSSYVKGQSDPVIGDFATAFPDAPLINGRYYFIDGNNQDDCTDGQADAVRSAAMRAFMSEYPKILPL